MLDSFWWDIVQLLGQILKQHITRGKRLNAVYPTVVTIRNDKEKY